MVPPRHIRTLKDCVWAPIFIETLPLYFILMNDYIIYRIYTKFYIVDCIIDCTIRRNDGQTPITEQKKYSSEAGLLHRC